MKTIQQKSCIRFIRRVKSLNYVFIEEGDPVSEIGYFGGKQQLSLSKKNVWVNICFSISYYIVLIQVRNVVGTLFTMKYFTPLVLNMSTQGQTEIHMSQSSGKM